MVNFMKKLLFILILIFTLFSPIAYGAELSLQLPKEIKEGNNFIASVYLDTKGLAINGADVAFTFDQDKISFVGYKKEEGVIQLYLDAPNTKGDTVSFSGIIPGGVSGSYDAKKQGLQKLNLVNLIFKAKEKGESDFVFIKSDIFKHDGKGTKIIATTVSNNISIKENVNKKEDEYKLEDTFDKTLPLPFDITYVDAELLSQTPPLLIFSAIDEDSGIAKYQIKKGNAWIDITSPYPVSKGIFSHDVVLRAVDYANNSRESSVSVPGSVSMLTIFIIIFVLVFGVYAYKLLQYKYAKKAKS